MSDSIYEILTEKSPVIEVASGVRGPQGDIGPAGPEGPQGPQGLSGELPLQEHIEANTPHPTYDDMSDLTLLFENGIT